MNPIKLMKMKGLVDTFMGNHPKFPMFLKAVSQNCITEGAIIEFNVLSADGKNYTSNLKLSASDIELIREMQEAVQSAK